MTSGWRASSCIMKVRVEVEVSWPANIRVITWSRISRSVNTSPASPRAPTRRLRMSWRLGIGSARRRAISPKTISSRTLREAIILRQGEPGPRIRRSWKSIP